MGTCRLASHAAAPMVAAVLLVHVPAARAETLELTAELSGAAQVPANPSKGRGSFQITYETASRKLTWSGTFSDLTGTPLAAHFHGPAEVTKNAPITVHITPPISPAKGEATLTEAQGAEVLAGMWYVNVHTPSYPGGELRGQVKRAGGN